MCNTRKTEGCARTQKTKGIEYLGVSALKTKPLEKTTQEPLVR